MGVLLVVTVIVLAFLSGANLAHNRRLARAVEEVRRRNDQITKQVDEIEDELRSIDDRRSARRRSVRSDLEDLED